jgi:hypothetical protein
MQAAALWKTGDDEEGRDRRININENHPKFLMIENWPIFSLQNSYLFAQADTVFESITQMIAHSLFLLAIMYSTY